MREIKFEFVFQHPKSEEVRIERFTLQEIIEQTDDDLLMLECDCESIGETNVVECNCEDYLEGFELIDKRQFTGLKDKNGKEIYEGDIVYVAGVGNCIVEWDENCAGWSFKNHSGQEDYQGVLVDLERIVGNIYEDTELI